MVILRMIRSLSMSVMKTMIQRNLKVKKTAGTDGQDTEISSYFREP